MPQLTRNMPAWRRDELRGRLEELISAQQLWGRRLQSDRSLALELGVNRRTLQKAMADLEAQGLLERRHGSGTWVRSRDAAQRRAGTGHLAIVTDRHFEHRTDWQYQAEMIRGAFSQSHRLKSDCTVLALNDPAERERIWDTRGMSEFNGFILVNVEDRVLVKHLVDLRRGPVVVIDREINNLPVTMVIDGAFDGMRAITRHLVSQGHRRIAYFHELGRGIANPDKLDGYRSGLLSAGLPFEDELLAVPESAQPEEAYAEFSVDRLLKLKDPPTAIVASRDHRALTLIKVLASRGLKAGRDISVAGFGDVAAREGICDDLTSCRIYPRKFGSEAVRAALGRVHENEARTIIVPDRLMVRSSTCPPGDTREPSPGSAKA